MVCSPLVRKGVALVLMMAVGQVLAAGRNGVSARADAAVGVTNAIPCPATGWTHSGGDRPTVEATAAGELRVVYEPTVGYGNLKYDVKLPKNAKGFAFQMKVVREDGSARRHLWLHEPDGDLWLTPVRPVHFTALVEPKPGEWVDVFVPRASFDYQPRGNRVKNPDQVDRILLGFNFGRQEVLVRDFRIVLTSPKPPLPPKPQTAAPSADAPRVCVLDGGNGAKDCIAALARQDVRARAVGEAELCHPEWFSKRNADVLVIPCSPDFPATAVGNFRKFLKEGGSFFAYGGYAFDSLRSGDDFLNARFGRAGDSVRIDKDLIQVFQPNNLVRFAADAVATDLQSLTTRTNWPGLGGTAPYHAAIADIGSGDPVFPRQYGRWIPVLESRDRFGRPRGAVLSVVHNWGGPYPSSSWAFSAHPTLFRRGAAEDEELMAAIVRNLQARRFIRTLRSDRMSAAAGEEVTVTATVQGAKSGDWVRFAADGTEFAIVSVTNGAAACTWRVGGTGVVTVRAELLAPDRIDAIETGVCVKAPPPKLPRLCWRDGYFTVDGRRRYFCGVNQTGMMWYSALEDPLVWKRDFDGMGDDALRMLRIIHFSPAAARGSGIPHSDPKALTCRQAYTEGQTDAIVQLAHDAGVGPLIALHDWMPIEKTDEELGWMREWDRFWVGRYADWPLVGWDMQNEIHPLRYFKPGDARYNRFIDGYYEAMGIAPEARALKKDAKGNYQPPVLTRCAWDDPAARDWERVRTWSAHRWMKACGEAVHGVRADIPVAPGFTRFGSADRQTGESVGMDYSVVHCYDGLPVTRAEMKLADRRFEGKGSFMGEYGCRLAHDARGVGMTGNPDRASLDYVLQCNLAFYGMGSAGSLYWTWKDMIDAEFPWGVNWPDRVPKPVVKGLRNLSILLGSGTPVEARPALWFLIPDGARLGGQRQRIDAELVTAADALLRVGVPFGVIDEQSLNRLPKEAQAIVWPYALAPRESDFRELVAFVRRGGKVLLSGSPVYDHETRQPSHPGRLKELGVGTDPHVVHSETVREKAGDVEALRDFYGAFVRDVAKLAPVKLPVADADGCVYELPQEDGTALVRDATPFLLRTSGGRRVAVLAQAGVPGLIVNDGAACGFLALDGRDLAESEMFLALPFGPAKRICLVRKPGELVAELGEFRGRKWHRLEGLDGKTDFAVDEETQTDLRLFAVPEKIEEARRLAAAKL